MQEKYFEIGSNMSKKLKIIIFILAVMLSAGGGFAVWNWGYKNNQENNISAENALQNNNTHDQIIKERFKYLTDESVFAPVLNTDSTAVWYFEKKSQKLYRKSLEDSQTQNYPLPDQLNIGFVLWPSKGSDFIIGAKSGKYLYDSQAHKFISYPGEVKYIEWVPRGSKVAYIWSDEQGATLSVANADLQDYRVVANLPHANFKISISPNGKSFVLYSNSGQDPVYLVIEDIEVLESLTQPRSIKDVKFSADGKTIAFTENTEGAVMLRTITLTKKQEINRGLLFESGDFTWSNNSNTLYWADPLGTIKSINTDTNQIKDVFTDLSINSKIFVSEIFLSPDDDILFFTDKDTGQLGRILLE